MKKKQFKGITFCIILTMFSFVLMSVGKSGKNQKEEDVCPTKTIPLTLYQGNINVHAINNRNSGWGSFMPVGNIINGQQATSPSSIYNNINLSYCYITITAIGCSNYGDGGTKGYIWDSSNDGDSYDSTMNIEVPKNGNFTITVDLHEGCGPWYNGYNEYKRAMWIHQKNYNSQSVISVSTWSLNRINNC